VRAHRRERPARKPRPWRANTDGGSASAELVLLAPLLVALLGVTFFAGRLVLARQAVDDAARTALQAALTMPDGTEANELADATTVEMLGTSRGLCAPLSTATDTSDFTAGGRVSVTVTCVVRFSNLAFAGIPGSITLSATREGDLEAYREIGP